MGNYLRQVKSVIKPTQKIIHFAQLALNKKNIHGILNFILWYLK